MSKDLNPPSHSASSVLQLEYGVLQLESAVMINSVETLKSSGGQPRSLSIQLRSGFSFFYSTVDTGSPVSFLNKRTCDFLLQRSPSIEFRDTLSIPCMLTITRSPFASWGRFKFRFFLVAGGWLTLSSSSRRIELVIFSVWTCRRNWAL